MSSIANRREMKRKLPWDSGVPRKARRLSIAKRYWEVPLTWLGALLHWYRTGITLIQYQYYTDTVSVFDVVFRNIFSMTICIPLITGERSERLAGTPESRWRQHAATMTMRSSSQLTARRATIWLWAPHIVGIWRAWLSGTTRCHLPTFRTLFTLCHLPYLPL